MDKFANNPDRKTFLHEARNRLELTDIIVEKDFWVCWTLRQISSIDKLAPYLTFKGGTSLSKAYNLIQRFSEDIDLTISRDAPHVSEGKDPMEDDISKGERERRIDTLKKNAQNFVHQVALPALNEAFQKSLSGKEGWAIEADKEDNDNQTLLFIYPKVFNYPTDGYILPRVKLEFGARGEKEPSEKKTISPYVVQALPKSFSVVDVTVATLSAERTFWEKATILHSLHHDSKLNKRMSRHYYDTFKMMEGGVHKKALETPTLLDQVVRNKSMMFSDKKASYETAKLGSLRLTPRSDIIDDLRKDYKDMNEMFMKKHPDFDTILNGLTELEKLLNSPSPAKK